MLSQYININLTYYTFNSECDPQYNQPESSSQYHDSDSAGGSTLFRRPFSMLLIS